MKHTLLTLCLGAVLWPAPAAAQVPRDTPPPAVENARRERDLRAAIAAGSATKDTYLELAGLLNRRGDFASTIDALEKAAALEPANPEGFHRVATFYWEKAHKDYDLNAAEQGGYLRKGLAMEDKALGLNPDYMDAMTYKSIILREQAKLTADSAEQARLIAEADALRNRVLQMQRAAAPTSTPGRNQTAGPEPPPPPFVGFPEEYNATVRRLAPIRVGDGIMQPTKVKDVKPVYPAEAQAAHVQGVVIVEAIVDESGSIANARVLRSIPMLDEAALSAVSRWQFTGTNANGQPVSVLVTVTVNFSLQDR